MYITLPAFDPKFSEMLSPKMFVDKFLILLNPNNIVEFIYSSSNILNEMLRQFTITLYKILFFDKEHHFWSI